MLAAGDEGELSSYAQRVVEDCQSLPAPMLWDAVEKLFPRHLDVAALLTIVGSVSVDGLERGGFSLDWGGPSLISAVTSGDDLVRLITGLLGQLPLEERKAARRRNRGRAELYASTLTTATERLLEVCPLDSIPTVAIDALMMVRGLNTYSTDARRSSIDRATELASCTSERRERLFWRAAELVRSNQAFDSAPLNAPWQMRMLGWPAALLVEDVAWLITDGLTRATADDRHLALNATLELWEQAGRPDDLSTKIDNAIRTDAELVSAYSRWIDPPAKPENQVRLEARLAAQREAAAADEEAAVQGWLKFIAKIQEAPDQLEHPDLSQATGVDTRHYNLWRLLYQATSRNSRYSVTTAAPLLEIVGPAVMKALEIGLSRIWRARKPKLERERDPNARNQVDLFDAMGLAAISLECLRSADAMAGLTSADAIRAAEYATLELNGFPSWLPVLAKTHPTEVQQVLMDAINAELHQPSAGYPYQILGDASSADDAVVRLLEAPLWTELSRNPTLDTRALEPILRILSRSRDIQLRSDLNELAVAQLRTASDVAICSLYFGAACAVDATSATDALLSKIESLPSVSERTLLAQHALPQAFGSRWTERGAPVDIDTATLLRLVEFAYGAVRIEDDRDHSDGDAWSPDVRDNAESARSAAFNMLVSRAGPETFDAIQKLAEIDGFPVTGPRLRALAHERAAADSEGPRWKAQEVVWFERNAEKLPATGVELQRLALARLDDLQHDLMHGDFQQGATLSALPSEVAVQNFLAERFSQAKGSSYSVEREVHVVGEKEPDIRLRSKVGDAPVSIEVKVASSWTLEQLEAALEVQLCGQYLRSNKGREGILLLVLLTPRTNGWQSPEGSFLTFQDVVARLRAQAAWIRQSAHDAPQPEIAVVDVSSYTASREPKNDKGSRQRSVPAEY